MTDKRRRIGFAPWVTAAVLGVVAIAMAAVLLFVVRPDRHRHKVDAKVVGLTAVEQQAVDAAGKQVLNLLTYSRKNFDADYARTVAGSTGALQSDLGKQKATLLSKMTKGKFDLQGSVTAAAFEESSGTNWLILVSAQGYEVPDKGTRTLRSTARFEITMTDTGGNWLASNLQSVGLV